MVTRRYNTTIIQDSPTAQACLVAFHEDSPTQVQQSLLDGAKIDVSSLLNFAIVEGKSKAMIQTLLESGANTESNFPLTDTQGDVPLVLAAICRPEEPGIVEALIQHGADVNHTRTQDVSQDLDRIQTVYPHEHEEDDMSEELEREVSVLDIIGNEANRLKLSMEYYQEALLAVSKEPTLKEESPCYQRHIARTKQYKDYQQIIALLKQAGAKSAKELQDIQRDAEAQSGT